MEGSEMEIEETPTTEINFDLFELLKEKIKEIERGVLKKEPKYIHKAVSRIFSIRKLLTEEVLKKLLDEHPVSRNELGQWVDFGFSQTVQEQKNVHLPEVDAFLHLLVLLKLLDSGMYEAAMKCSDRLVEKVCSINQRTMDSISARAYFYHSKVYEANGKLDKIRNFLISRLRTCTLKSDICGQAILINCILRNYLEYKLYENADVFVSKIRFPDHADNNEYARFLYYLARIKATRLEYSEAQRNVTLALRKAPESSALGFKQAATKLAVCVELLLGDIPDKKIFKTCKMKNSLEPYLKLSQAVRDGNLHQFGEVLETHRSTFQKDHTYNLILRLRRNVIKIAIRSIGLSYSKITAAEVAKKLGLDNAEEAMYILAKAIRDNVLEASLIDDFLVSQEIGDLYKTLIPTDIYNERIEACLELHNHSVKSMRYPMKKYESKLDSSNEQDDVDEDFDIFLM